MRVSKKIYSLTPTDPPANAYPEWVNVPHVPSPDGVRRLLPGPHIERRSETFGIGSGFPTDMEVPLLQFQGPVQDGDFVDVLLGGREYWLSDKAKRVFESVDAPAFEFREVRTRLSNGRAGPRYWLCDIVRFLPAIDEVKSGALVKTLTSWETGQPVKRISPGVSGTNVFRSSVVDGFHAFRELYAPRHDYYDEQFVSAVSAAQLSGICPFPEGALDD